MMLVSMFVRKSLIEDVSGEKSVKLDLLFRLDDIVCCDMINVLDYNITSVGKEEVQLHNSYIQGWHLA